MGWSRIALVSSVLVVALPSPLLAQAPRGTAAATVGSAKISIEYGAPPWSEQRRGQMEQALPVGALWRLGADGRTTLVVDGGAIAIGDALIEPGGYGFNLRRTGEKEWAFVVFDGSDSTAHLEDASWEAPATLTEKKEGAPERLEISFAEAGGKKSLVVRWGPLELSAPATAVETRESELSFGGESSSARWYSRNAADAPRAGAWTRVGTLGSFFVGDVDCGVDIDLKVEGNSAKLRFKNRERSKVADRLEKVERDLAAASKAASAQGPTARRFQSQVKTLEAQKAELDEELAGLAANPAPVEIEVALQPAKKASGKFTAELVRRGGKLVATVDAGDRGGETAIDESKLLPAPGKGPAKN